VHSRTILSISSKINNTIHTMNKSKYFHPNNGRVASQAHVIVTALPGTVKILT